MTAYHLGSTQEDLQDWPFDNPASRYVILEGTPRASGRIDRGNGTAHHRLGIWRCTPGAFECTERGDELQTIISGRLKLVRGDGSTEAFGPGDSFFTLKGERVQWHIEETVTKVFFTHDPDGDND